MNSGKLIEKLEQMLDLFSQIKEEVRNRDKHLYERWKAGGFIVDNDILSMYPNVEQVVNQLAEEDDVVAVDDETGEYRMQFDRENGFIRQVDEDENFIAGWEVGNEEYDLVKAKYFPNEKSRDE